MVSAVSPRLYPSAWGHEEQGLLSMDMPRKVFVSGIGPEEGLNWCSVGVGAVWGAAGLGVCSAGAILVWYRRHCCIKWQLYGRRKGESFSVGQEWKVFLGGYHWGQLGKEWQHALANAAEWRCSQRTSVHSQNQNLRAQHTCTHMHTHAHTCTHAACMLTGNATSMHRALAPPLGQHEWIISRHSLQHMRSWSTAH